MKAGQETEETEEQEITDRHSTTVDGEKNQKKQKNKGNRRLAVAVVMGEKTEEQTDKEIMIIRCSFLAFRCRKRELQGDAIVDRAIRKRERKLFETKKKEAAGVSTNYGTTLMG
ncbi:hypothetical protein AVEN_152088-1 [Araneus ventricosus]|uniref:Uncharacterized protein n=1 Tax=Araneus ventricosus TaxID=182803 RepID=A0A4Y2T089_ARAVE|nr:hypothetical protein AVEN_152088-1 [Araneus ventricosus]